MKEQFLEIFKKKKIKKNFRETVLGDIRRECFLVREMRHFSKEQD